MRIRFVGLGFLERMSKQSYTELFSIWLSLVGIFAMLYFILTILHPAHGISVNPQLHILYKLLDSLYFSIVTATTTGYGDMVPYGFSKALACLQIVIAFGTFSIFLAKLVAEDQKILAAKPLRDPKPAAKKQSKKGR
jgi:voltage-gated potassium channel Kch